MGGEGRCGVELSDEFREGDLDGEIEVYGEEGGVDEGFGRIFGVGLIELVSYSDLLDTSRCGWASLLGLPRRRRGREKIG